MVLMLLICPPIYPLFIVFFSENNLETKQSLIHLSNNLETQLNQMKLDNVLSQSDQFSGNFSLNFIFYYSNNLFIDKLNDQIEKGKELKLTLNKNLSSKNSYNETSCNVYESLLKGKSLVERYCLSVLFSVFHNFLLQMFIRDRANCQFVYTESIS